MSKWEDEFIETHKTTKKLRKHTEQWRKLNKKESKKVNEILKRFYK